MSHYFLCSQNKDSIDNRIIQMLAKQNCSRDRKERTRRASFVWEIRRNSVGVPSARPLLGWFSTAKFYSSAPTRSRTSISGFGGLRSIH